MKKNILHTIIALLLGALSLYIFFALIGVVTVWSAKSHLYAWIFNLPKTCQPTAFLLHNNLEELIVAVPVLGVAGLILGITVNKKPVLFGLIAFVGALCFFFIYHMIVFDGNLIWIDSVPAWSQILPYFMWLLIFVCTSLIGNKKLKKYFLKS